MSFDERELSIQRTRNGMNLTFAENLIQPLLQWSWLATVPLRMAEKSSRTSLAVANGQFFIAKRISLEAISGFNQISHQVLDDIELARALIGAGFHGMHLF